MNRKQKFKYMKTFIREKKIKDGFMKRGIYGSMLDIPKKIEKSIKMAKNKNHKNYMLNTFEKLAKVSKSYNVLRYIEEIKNEQKN
jgi:mannitol/fructose-specific phosphotransferase system IIA component (Ntr-type)